MATFVWIAEDGARTFEAENDEAAYEKVIAFRMSLGQTREDAEGWFQKNDQIVEVVGQL